MNEQRAILEKQKSHCEEKVRGLKAYVRELTEMSAKHGRADCLHGIETVKSLKDAPVKEGD